jgi:cytochrome c oxidase cbb3-type subunit III
MAGKDFDGITYRDDGNRSPLIFRILYGCLAVWGLLFMGYYLFNGWSSDKEFAEKQKIAAAKSADFELKEKANPSKGGDKKDDPAAALVSGKKIFSERCVACHGPDAKGGIGPDLTKAAFKYGKSESAILESISNGRPGGMPGFGKELGHEQLEGIVKYLLTLK